MAVPDKGFKLTTEILLAKTRLGSAGVKDFRDPITLQSTYWTTLSGSWAVWRSDEYASGRVYSQLEGSGQLARRCDVLRHSPPMRRNQRLDSNGITHIESGDFAAGLKGKSSSPRRCPWR